MHRLSIPGNLCTHCDTVMGQSVVCPGCGWADPLTKSPSHIEVDEELERRRRNRFDVV